MFRSATFKLTMYYLLIIAVISISFSFAIYQVTARDLKFGLQRQSQRITDHFPVFSDSPYLRNSQDLQDSRSHLAGRLVLLNVFVLVGAGFASYALARRTLRPIEAAHERQKRFTADVSHELRTPLTALKMESEVALMDPKASKDELRDVIGSNVEEAEKLTNLVGDLLRLSQLDDDEKLELHDSVKLNEVVQGAIERVQPVATDRSITLDAKLGKSLKVQADRSMLTQLFVILLDNAIKYSPDGSNVAVTIKAEQQLAHISITDQGSGIAKEDLDHVFERFYRADLARTSGQAGGFGIGLSIAQLIADNHNATISLSSTLGKGTTASVVIPVAGQPTEKRT